MCEIHRTYTLAVGVLLVAVILASGAFATYVMATHPGDFFNMQEMHRRMMGGGTDTSGTQLAKGSTQQAVQIRDFAFTPGNLQAAVGSTVTWTNYDSAPHSATANDGSWDTGTLSQGEQASITFEKPGDYSYYCTVHPDIKAHLRVQ